METLVGDPGSPLVFSGSFAKLLAVCEGVLPLWGSVECVGINEIVGTSVCMAIGVVGLAIGDGV